MISNPLEGGECVCISFNMKEEKNNPSSFECVPQTMMATSDLHNTTQMKHNLKFYSSFVVSE
ncbi:CLUMA_CG013631, isoform A [Clunio marinus]|uniref:CLUMA_CG013631, isoform A n=1 Tax=Clunio marinus TaxID=568069 RepID=A0A1J1IJI9_9DIPT|nr:CLUMA_CG013631, isoform A [Clunio marinus]